MADWGSIIGGVIGAGIGSFGGPVTAGMGGAIGAGVGSEFGGNPKSSKELSDPLAGIRQQLINAAGGYAELATKQKALNAAMFERMYKEGGEDIMETSRGTRGFGANTIELDWKRKLMEDLTSSLSESDLKADQWAKGGELSALQAAMGNPGTFQDSDDYTAGMELGSTGVLNKAGVGLEDLFKSLKTKTTDSSGDGTGDFAKSYAKTGGTYLSPTTQQNNRYV